MLYDPKPMILLVKALELVLIIPGTYFIYTFILPRSFSKKYPSVLLGTAILIITYSLLRRLLFQWALFPLYYDEGGYSFEFLNWYRIIADLWTFIGFAALFVSIQYMVRYQKDRVRLNQLRAEKKSAELQFLKAQIHPHFLFNTLNALYYEVLKKSDNAPDLIIELSEVLRFVLHESKNETIALLKEITLVEKYAQLMQRRYGSRLDFKLKNELDTSDEFPPMLLFSIVENAFKHGVSDEADACFVHVEVTQINNFALFRVQNSRPFLNQNRTDAFGSKEGISMENLKRQLDLYYGENYRLNIKENEDIYTCELLIIPLE
ncbi:MAG: hypothetical protein Crog4KO_00790 [Crocinitomicaceae bacterium]